MNPQSLMHLVGSVPLADSETVFSVVTGAIGQHICRLPDGETGERGRWISFQREMLSQHPAVMLNPEGRTFPTRDLKGNVRRQNELFVLNPTVPVESVSLLPLGYSEAARNSWMVFSEQKRDGKIPAGTRFQVSMPTPLATGLLYFHPDSQAAFVELMRAALLHELAEICEVIPHDELAIQWDCCPEILQLEGYFPEDWQFDADAMATLVAAMGDAVPSGVEVGYHFCYGSPVDEPLVRQKDMGVVTRFCNAVLSRMTRPLNFVHLPVSVIDADRMFFAPLGGLQTTQSTDVYLGLLNPRDPDGDAARIAAAREVLPTFGVATECGWGRKSDDSVDSLLSEHQRAVPFLK